MKDLLIRILVSSVIGAIVSAGILYFAFDQSMRGMEVAISSVNNQISENGEWLHSQDQKLERIQTTLDQKLGEISTKIGYSAKQSLATFANHALLQEDILDEVVVTITITSDLMSLILKFDSIQEPERKSMEELLRRLAESQSLLIEHSNVFRASFLENITNPTHE